MSPNTIKAVLNKAGLDRNTSISSRAFELYVQQKTPLEVAIALNLTASNESNLHRLFKYNLKLIGLKRINSFLILFKDLE